MGGEDVDGRKRLDEDLRFRAQWLCDQISKERDWIAQRTGWNLTVQGFLIAAIGISPDKPSVYYPFLLRTAPLLGIAMAAFTMSSVWAAYARQADVRRHWENGNWDAFDLPAPFGGAHIHRFGYVSARFLPVAIIIFWILAIILVKLP